jgi:mono/diheme cytochrome c family protein
MSGAVTLKAVFAVLLASLLGVALAVYLFQRLHDPDGNVPGVPVADASQQLRTGAYLARAGNCMTCHTARGGAQYAGGRMIATPFGNLFTPNITSDRVHGIGAWSADDFWRALHNGKSRDGSFLYPAFPYTAYTRMSRADSDALFAWLRTVPPASRANQPHALRFPYDQRFLLAGWRALYFRPGTLAPQPERSAQWNRGAYLVEGVGHCSACHAERNAVGATLSGSQLGGGMIATLDWYAPSLSASAEAGLRDWSRRDVVDLLHTGVSRRGSVFGPMAEVVAQSLQYLDAPDIDAMATYLQALPGDGVATAATGAAAATAAVPLPNDSVMAQGAALYRTHCIDCHGKDGRGAPPAYPPLAGNRALLMASAVNPIRMVLNGGFAPATAGNPRPFGMPPFGPVLDDAQVAAVVSYLRAAWGNGAAAVSSEEVGRYRAVPVE